MNKYNDIELTQEELDGLSGVEETPKDIPKDSAEAETAETTTSQLETTEESSKEVNDTDVDGDGFEIDGERYDADTIKAWMSDSQNKAEWQKSNTQKSQELAKWNKFAEKLNGDDEFKEHIKDFFFDSPDDFEKLGLDSLPVQETEEEPTHLEERMDRLEEFESDRILEHRVDSLDRTLSSLEKAHPELLTEEGVREFLDFADKNADTFMDGDMPNLDRAFREWSYDTMQEQLTHFKKLNDNKLRNEGKVVGNSEKGAVEVAKPNKAKSYKDISYDDPEIAKYFEQ